MPQRETETLHGDSESTPLSFVHTLVIGSGAAGLNAAVQLRNEGVDDDDAEYYESRINSGGYFVGVHADRAGTSIEEAREILYRNGGHSAKRAREATA